MRYKYVKPSLGEKKKKLASLHPPACLNLWHISEYCCANEVRSSQCLNKFQQEVPVYFKVIDSLKRRSRQSYLVVVFLLLPVLSYQVLVPSKKLLTSTPQVSVLKWKMSCSFCPPPSLSLSLSLCLSSSLCVLLWGCLRYRYTANSPQNILKRQNIQILQILKYN